MALGRWREILWVSRWAVAAAITALVSSAGVATAALAGDGGWVRLGPAGVRVLTLAADPSGPGRVLAGTIDGRVLRWDDTEREWTTLVELGAGAYVESLVADPADPDVMWAAVWGRGVLRGTEAGSPWAELKSGLTDLRLQSIALDPDEPSTILAGTAVGVYRSEDAGASWRAANDGLARPGLPGSTVSVRSVLWDPASPGRVLAGTSSGAFASVDAGIHWAASNQGLAWPSLFETGFFFVNDIMVDPRTEGALLAASDGGVFTSADGGASWLRHTEGLAISCTWIEITYVCGGGARAVAGNPLRSGEVLAATAAGVFRSLDGAVSWLGFGEGLTTPETWDVLVDARVGAAFLATDDGVFRRPLEVTPRRPPRRRLLSRP